MRQQNARHSYLKIAYGGRYFARLSTLYHKKISATDRRYLSAIFLVLLQALLLHPLLNQAGMPLVLIITDSD